MATDKGKDAPPTDLRDTLVIWAYATCNSDKLNSIIDKTKSAKDLETELVQQGFIRKDNTNNQNTCEDVVENIKNNNQTFLDVQSAFTGMRVFNLSWGGSTQHPRSAELNNVLNVAQPLSRLGAGSAGAEDSAKKAELAKEADTNKAR